MKRRRAAWLFPLAALSVWEGCDRHAPPAPDVVARIGEADEVRYSEFESYLEATVGDGESVLASDVLSQLFDQFLDETLLVRLAVDRGLVQAENGRGARRRAIDALLREGLRGEPSPAEVEAWYRQHRQELARPERVRLRQILTEDRAAAERALREIAGGADFAQVARRLSREPGAASGGYQGELSREDLPPAFADVIFSLEPGEVSPVVPADYGFHIFQVMDRAPAEVVPLEDVREEILGRLRRERADRLLASLVSEARGRYDVEVHARNLPFNYVGSYR